MKTKKLMKILVAEDNAVNVAVLRVLLQRGGCEATCVTDGLSALNLFAKDKYDLVFMDLQLPIMDGFEAIREMRKLEKTSRKTPIVVLSACTLAEDQRLALEAGADSYLAKPLRSRDVLEVLSRWGPRWYKTACSKNQAA